MFAVCVKPSERKRICTDGLVWVKSEDCAFYVKKKDRGLWETREEARKAITEPCEIVVEVKN